MSVVDSRAQIGEGVTIGPFCQVGPDAVLGDGVELVSHVVVIGRTTIGGGTRIYPFASIGHPPQDLKYRGEPSTLLPSRSILTSDDAVISSNIQPKGLSR